MLLKITEKCSMGCSHCMNDAKPTGKHMSFDTLTDSIDFILKRTYCSNIIVTGGEPTEHPEFEKFIKEIISRCKDFCNSNLHKNRIIAITITTNGFWIIDNQEKAKEIVNMSNNNVIVVWQISTDRRYYPKRLDVTKRIFREKGFYLCDDCVVSILPLGRARSNNISYNNRKSSSCYNIRAITHQINPKYFSEIVSQLEVARKFCTPSIKINGNLCLSESDLCKDFGSIYDSDEDLIKNIMDFRCEKCGLNNHLPKMYRDIIKID